MTDLPLLDTKQPEVPSVPLSAPPGPLLEVLSAASAAHNAASAAIAEAARGTEVPLTPLVFVQVTAAVLPPGPKPAQNGMELEPDLKSAEFPKKSQRSAVSPLWLQLMATGLLSLMFQGWGV